MRIVVILTQRNSSSPQLGGASQNVLFCLKRNLS